MKPVLLRFVHVLMAALVLFSSMGMGVAERTCALRGKQTTAGLDPQTGCHRQAEHCQVRVHTAVGAHTTVRRADCCQVSVEYGKVATGWAFGRVSALANHASDLPFIPTETTRFSFCTHLFGLQNESGSQTTYSPPPPFHGRALRLLFQTFLI